MNYLETSTLWRQEHNGFSHQSPIRFGAANNPRLAPRANKRISHYEYILQDYHRFIIENGEDPPEITNWRW